jgi:O-antigen ligase
VAGWLTDASQLESILAAAVRDALRRFPLERALQLAIALAIVTSVLAAGAILSWIETARRLRWAMLVAVVVLALAFAFRERRALSPAAASVCAAVFIALALVSAAWSGRPALTASRAAALALLLVACAALSYATAGRPELVERVLDGVLLGVGAVAVGGLLVLLFEHDRAVAPATTALPARYQGLGGGPNTATMVLAVGVPLAAFAAFARDRPRGRRLVGAGLLALLLGSIVASGSRGALASAFGGLLAYALLRETALRRRALAAAAVGAAFAIAVGLTRIPDPLPPASVNPPEASVEATAPFTPEITPRRGYVDANLRLRLQDEVGAPPLGVADTERRPRTLLGTSGRAEAWSGALEQAAERPLLGHGFGTEDRVFVDRYVNFNSGTPENSYVGLLLQLGAVGLVAFLALAALLLVPAVRASAWLSSRELHLAAACAGGLVAGLVLGFFQSYLYAVGNNATAAVWICGFLLAAVTTGRVSASRS